MTCNFEVPGSHENMFVGNPVRLSIETDTAATYTLYVGDVAVYVGSVFGPTSVNVADVFSPYFTDAPGYPEEQVSSILKTPLQSNHVLQCRVAVSDETGDNWESSFNLWRGGVPKAVWRVCTSEDWDIFTQRFLNPSGNFFMTCRSSGYRNTVRETEAGYLFFIYPCATDTLVVKETMSGASVTLQGNQGMLYALDLTLLRKWFFVNKNKLPSKFEVWTDVGGSDNQNGVLACEIQFEEGVTTNHRYIVTYRNSYGMMESIDLNGKANVSTSVDSGEEEGEYVRYDEVTDSFVKVRHRPECKQSFPIVSGIKRPNEVELLRDLLVSDKVWLTVDGYDYEVIPSMDSVTRTIVSEEPEQYQITFSVVETESHFGIMSDEVFSKPRLFSYHFDDKFN